MKTDIHPKNYRSVAFQDTNTGAIFIIKSCVHTTETVKHEGNEYPLYKTEISSASHPFYTGKKMTVDTAGRIEKFEAQRKAAEAKKVEQSQRSKKERKRNTFEDKVNEELQKQLNADKKKEEKLMAKIKKNSTPKTSILEDPSEEATKEVVEETTEEVTEEVAEEATEEVAEEKTEDEAAA